MCWLGLSTGCRVSGPWGQGRQVTYNLDGFPKAHQGASLTGVSARWGGRTMPLGAVYAAGF